MTDERITVQVLVVVGDQAEIVANVPAEERAEPARYATTEIAAAVGLPVDELAGARLTAAVGPDNRLTDWQRA